jgi:hypothetical protein
MKQLVFAVLMAGLIVPLSPAPVTAGPIDRACMSSPRKQKSVALCRCIQRAADQVLTRGEQRKAARFFRDPHRAQEIRQSDSPANERFWQRYRAFGDRAVEMCS